MKQIPNTTGLIVATVMAVALPGCDIETYKDEASAFYENAPPPSNPPPIVTPPPGGGSFGPNFSEIQAAVFTPSCATVNCHSGAAPAAGLNLDSANSHAMLVGVASTQDSALQRVRAGSPASSYLIQKLEGTAVTGSAMPPGGSLPQADIDVIKQWITDGAIDDRISPPAAPVRVTSISPAVNVTLNSAPTQIVAGFDRETVANSVNAATFVLTPSGGDNIFDGSEPPVTATSITMPTTRTAVFSLAGVNLVDDRYRIRLAGTGATVISDLDGNALDGEYLGRLPSGDGSAGGDFLVEFTISTPPVSGPTLAQIQAAIFTPSCAGACHAGNNPSGNLDLSDANTSYQQLVGVMSTQDNAILRVAAGNADNSYLVMKMEGSAANGTVMPPSGMLSPTLIADVRQWIADGAAPP